MVVYRLLSGPDDAAFCHRITEALSRGWTLYGNPVLTFDPERNCTIAAQAITKYVDVDYSPELELNAL